MSARPWLEHYDEGVPPSLEPYPERTLLDYLRDGAAERPDHAAVLFKGATLSIGRLERESDAFAAALFDLGVRKGDRVALLLPNCPQFLVAEIGAWKAGAIVAPLNPVYTPRELAESMSRIRPEAIVVLNRFVRHIRAIRSSTTLRSVVTTGIKEYLPPVLRVLYTLVREKKDGERIRMRDEHRLPDLLRRYRSATRPHVKVSPDDPAILLLTGGTTGTPKSALGLHRHLVLSGLQGRTWLGSLLSEWDDVVLLPLPLFHVYANAGMQPMALVNHNPIALVPNPRDVDDLVKTIARTRPAFFVSVPALFSALLAHPKIQSGEVDMSSIRGCFSGAAPLLAETKRRFEETTGATIVEGYSLTEAMMACCGNPALGENKVGSVGMPLPDVEARIVDPDDPDTALALGEEGELLMRAPQLMEGYWEDPEATAEAMHIDPDGDRWLRTGDLAALDEDGYVRIVDRKKDLIKVSGLQVWPREVEEVLAAHPAVADVGVAGIPHERKGEVPKAWVVLREGLTATGLELRDYCREGLAPFKVPAEVEIVDELPRNMAGKVLRRELRAREAAAAGEHRAAERAFSSPSS